MIHLAGWGGQLLTDARGAGALEGLLQSTGAGRQRALTALEPIFKEWQALQVCIFFCPRQQRFAMQPTVRSNAEHETDGDSFHAACYCAASCTEHGVSSNQTQKDAQDVVQDPLMITLGLKIDEPLANA